jgi:hypothetical protein
MSGRAIGRFDLQLRKERQMKNHPVYDKLKAASEASGRMAYLDTADAAKCIRSALKAKFPKTTFSVTISRYSGGSSVRIWWMDGPVSDLVEAVTAGFEGKGFDGMIDMAYSKETFLMPDGSAVCAGSGGTTGSMGVVPASHAFKPAAEAIRVSGSAYVFCNRSLSKEFLERALAAYSRKFHGSELADAIDAGAVTVKVSEPGGSAWVEGAGHIRVCNNWGDSEIHRFAARRMVAA